MQQPPDPTTDAATFDQWCVIEQLGHRRLAGRVRETTIAGAGMLRLDVPATDGHGEQTHYLSPGSIYALHPVDEQLARAVAARCRPEPVHRWELPAAPAVAVPETPIGHAGDPCPRDCPDCSGCVGGCCDCRDELDPDDEPF